MYDLHAHVAGEATIRSEQESVIFALAFDMRVTVEPYYCDRKVTYDTRVRQQVEMTIINNIMSGKLCETTDLRNRADWHVQIQSIRHKEKSAVG